MTPFISNSRRALPAALSLTILALLALSALSCSKLGDPVLEPPPREETSSLPVIANRGDTTISEGQNLDLVFSASDPDRLGLVYRLDGEGVLSGDRWSWRPDTSKAGTHTVRIIVSVQGHLERADTLGFRVIVLDDPTPRPTLQVASEFTISEGQPFYLLLTASSPRNRGVNYSVSGPPGVAMFSSTNFAWTPSYAQAGVYDLVFTVTEQGPDPRSDSRIVRFTVLDVDRPPVLQPLRDTVVDTSATLQFTLSATDPDGDPVTYSMPGRPAGSTLNGAVFRWKPRPTQIGANTLRVVATSKNISVADTVVVTVVAVRLTDSVLIPVVLPDPVASWSFDNGTATAAPSEPGGRPISLVGGPVKVAGVSGMGVRFDGTTAQYGEGAGAFPDMTEQTLATWVYVDSLDKMTITLIQESDGASGHDNELSIERPTGSAEWRFMYRTRDPDGRHFSKAAIQAKKWYYLAGVAKRDTVHLYVNGALDTSLTTGPYNLSGNHYRIQLARKHDGNRAFPYTLRGILDEIKLFDVALTPRQIQSEWNRHKTAAGY